MHSTVRGWRVEALRSLQVLRCYGTPDTTGVLGRLQQGRRAALVTVSAAMDARRSRARNALDERGGLRSIEDIETSGAVTHAAPIPLEMAARRASSLRVLSRRGHLGVAPTLAVAVDVVRAPTPFATAAE